MNGRAAKELLHIRDWMATLDDIVERGRQPYLESTVLQEAGDSLMMKIGEAANRLSRLDVAADWPIDWAAPIANRNFLIHQYEAVDRRHTWDTLSMSFPSWHEALRPFITEASLLIEGEDGAGAPSAFLDGI